LAWAGSLRFLSFNLLCGAERLYLTDVVRYLDEQTLNLARHNIQLHAGLIEQELQLPPFVIKEFLEEAPRLQQEGRLEYLALREMELY
jgi:hypothetical protein